MQVEKDNLIKVHYTGKLDSGEVFDSSVSRDPLAFTVGAGQVIPGFEDAVVGMAVNETKEVTIPYDEAYGPSREDLIYEIQRAQLPDDLDPKVGMELVTRLADNSEMVVKIVDVIDELIKIDANHPLAGENLTFEITVVEIN